MKIGFGNFIPEVDFVEYGFLRLDLLTEIYLAGIQVVGTERPEIVYISDGLRALDELSSQLGELDHLSLRIVGGDVEIQVMDLGIIILEIRLDRD